MPLYPLSPYQACRQLPEVMVLLLEVDCVSSHNAAAQVEECMPRLPEDLPVALAWDNTHPRIHEELLPTSYPELQHLTHGALLRRVAGACGIADYLKTFQ